MKWESMENGCMQFNGSGSKYLRPEKVLACLNIMILDGTYMAFTGTVHDLVLQSVRPVFSTVASFFDNGCHRLFLLSMRMLGIEASQYRQSCTHD